METPYRFDDWFLHNWSRAALPLAVVIGVLSPLVFKAYGLTALLVVLHLVIYMVHQYEEHAQGKFKAFANQLLAGGQPKIGDAPIFWVNIVGVWGVYLVVIYGAIGVNPALGLISAYTTVVNGLLHVIAYVVTRRYNPGLITSVLLFLPVGAYTVFVISQLPATTSADHMLGLGAAILVHLVTFGYLGRIARG
jgi:hypothetical protein